MTGPKQPRARVPDGKGRRRHSAAHRGAATAAGHVNSRHARPSVGHRPTVEGWGPAQSRCRKGLRRSLAGVPCAADTGWVVQMAVLDHVLGERGADRNLAIESTLVGLPSELSSSALRIPRSGASREESQRSMPPRQRCLTSGNHLLAFAAVDRRLEISVIEDDEGRAAGEASGSSGRPDFLRVDQPLDLGEQTAENPVGWLPANSAWRCCRWS